MRPVYEPHHNVTHMSELLYDLVPWTQYAVYVQAFTIASSDRGAMSDIHYFRTKSDGAYILFIAVKRLIFPCAREIGRHLESHI